MANQLPSDQASEQSKKGVNPIVAILVAVLLALLLAGSSFIFFLRSDVRHSEQLTQNNDDSELLEPSPDTSSGVNVEDIEKINSDIQETVDSIDTSDFDSSSMSDSTLGL